MRRWLRKLRAMAGNGVVWAVAWMLGSLAFTVLPMFVWGLPLSVGTVLAIVANGAFIGFGTGVLFSLVLGVAYRNRVLEDIRGGSLGVFGAVAGMFLPVGFWALTVAAGNPFPAFAAIPGIVMSAGVGWATAVGSLRFAKSADPDMLDDGRVPHFERITE